MASLKASIIRMLSVARGDTATIADAIPEPRSRDKAISTRRDATGRVLVRVVDTRWFKHHEIAHKNWRHNSTTSLAKRTRRQAGAAP